MTVIAVAAAGNWAGGFGEGSARSWRTATWVQRRSLWAAGSPCTALVVGSSVGQASMQSRHLTSFVAVAGSSAP